MFRRYLARRPSEVGRVYRQVLLRLVFAGTLVRWVGFVLVASGE